MHHVAIMSKQLGMIPKILSGEKTIESRWYQTRRAPWGRAEIGDVIFFKNAGEPVTAQAEISEVLQFEIQTPADGEAIIKKYGKQICITSARSAKYCILLRLNNPKPVKSFKINNKGRSAWLILPI